MTNLIAYEDFLRRKAVMAPDAGFAVTLDEINPILKLHQKLLVQWGVAGGRRAIFAKFGLGKSVIQLEICRLILLKSGGTRALITAPLGVRQEFKRDAAMLGAELNPGYFLDGCAYLKMAEREMATPTLFDLNPEELEVAS